MNDVFKKSFAMGLIAIMMTGALVGVGNFGKLSSYDPLNQEMDQSDLPLPAAGSEYPISEFTTPSVKGTMKVVIATNNVAALARGLSTTYYEGTLGENAAPGLAFPILTLPIDSIPMVEAIDGVLGIYPFQEAYNEVSGAPDATEQAAATPPATSAYTGADTSIAILDSGIDFAHPALAGKYSTVPAIGTSEDELVLTFTNQSISQAFLNYGNVNAGTLSVFINGNLLNTTEYTANLVTGQLDFDPPISSGSKISASYKYASPYAGWPQAYDPAAMKSYVDSNGEPTGGYINTTYNGTGPFESRHTIELDGESDFAGSETMGFVSSPMGDASYKLENLQMTRDIDTIYAGFLTFVGNPQTNLNMSYAMYFDMDGSTSGASFDPHDNYINTASSHANWVNYVGMNPDSSLVASLGGGKSGYTESLLRIWNSDGTLVKSLDGHEIAPRWASWAGNTQLVSADLGRFYVWDVNAGVLLRTVNYNAASQPKTLETGEYPHAIIDVSANGTWVAIAGKGSAAGGVGIWNIDGTPIKNITLTASANAHSVDFSPDGLKLAVGRSNNSFQVFDVVTGAPLLSKWGQSSNIFSIKWNAAGNRIVTGSRDGTMRLWDYPAGNLIYTWNIGFELNDISWSDDDSKIAVATVFTLPEHNKVIVYDANTPSSTPMASFPHGGGVNSLDWDGDTIFSAAKDTRVRVMDVSPALPAEWNITGIFYSHRVDYALYFNHRGVEWGFDDEGEIWSNNDTFRSAELFKWTGTDWELITGVTNTTIGITRENSVLLCNNTVLFDGEYYEVFDNSTMLYNEQYIDVVLDRVAVAYNDWATYPSAEGYVEAGIPRYLLEDPDSMEVNLFSTADVPSRPQATVPADPNVELMAFDGSTSPLSLSAFIRYTPPIITVNSTAIISKSNRYHIGFHPDKNIAVRGIVAVLVTDPNVSGVYDTVIVDGNMDMVIDQDDTVLNKATPAAPLLFYDMEGALTIYPSGLLYYISDGKNTVPYLRPYISRYAGFDENFTKYFVPGNGEIVCMTGEFALGTSHGTNAASVIENIAPDSRVVPVGNMADASFFDALYFAAEGYDGTLGSSDDIDIAYIGVKYELDPETGWDVYSKFADWISSVYSNNSLAIVAGAGDRGYGYGTVSAPGAAESAITVGWSQDYNVETSSAGPHPKSGDVSPVSSRGPTFAGVSKPDILDLGQANAANPYSFTNLWTVWSGSDAAAARTAGSVALLSEAYSSAHSGARANAPTLKGLLMSGADSLYLDGNVQGAGLVNLERSLQLANTTAGVSVSPSSWSPGSWGESVWASAPRVLAPGDTANTSFTLKNEYDAPRTASVSSGQYRKIGELSSFVPMMTNSQQWSILINETGVYQPDGIGGLEYISSISQTVWNMADTVKIRATAPWNQVYLDDGGYVYLSHKFELAAYDLTVATASTPFPASSLNSFAKMSNTNSLQVEVKDPARRVSDGYGLVVNLIHQYVPFESLAEVNWTVDLEFYSWDEWDWIDTDTSLSLAAGSSGTFTATATVPADTKAGTYDGAISIQTSPVSITDETVSVYPINTVTSEILGDYTYANVTDQEILGNPIGGEATAAIVTSDPIVPGSVELWLERYWTNATWIYNTTGTEPYDADWVINITLPHTGAYNLDVATFEWDTDYDTLPDVGMWSDPSPMDWGDPWWPILDSPTGNMSIGLGEYYGTEVWASYRYSDRALVEGTDYTVNAHTGLVTFSPSMEISDETVANPRQQANADISRRFFLDEREILDCTLYAEDLNTHALTKMTESATPGMYNYILNDTWGFIDLQGWELGTDIGIRAYYNASIMAKGFRLMGNYSTVGSSFDDIALAHPYFEDVVMYVDGAPISDALYSIIPGRGDITFNPPLISGSVANVSYKWYEPKTVLSLLLDNKNIVPGTLHLFSNVIEVPAAGYTANMNRGAITLSAPQDPGTVYTASYQYYSWTTTVPVSITILASLGNTIGGEDAYSVVNEAVSVQSLDFIDDEYLFSTTPTAVTNETIAKSVVNEVTDEFVVSNPVFSVYGELLFTATGSEGIGYKTVFDHNDLTDNVIITPVEIYEDGNPLTANVDYILTPGSQNSKSGAGTVEFFIAPKAGSLYTADYSYCAYRPLSYLDHGDTNMNETIISGSLTVYINGIPLPYPADYTYSSSAQIILRSGLYVNPGDIMTASYSYTSRIIKVSLTYGTLNSPETSILPGSVKLYNNGVLWWPKNATYSGNYTLNEDTGEISLTPPLGAGTLLTATYQYYSLVDSAQLFRGIPDNEAIANGTLRLYNGGIEIQPSNYSIDYATGHISFNVLPAPNTVVNASYAYYNPSLVCKNEMSLDDIPYGVNYIALNNNDVKPDSVIVKKNGVPLPSNDISVDAETGYIYLLTTTVSSGDIFTVSYDYAEPGMYSMMPSSMIGGGEYGDWRLYYIDVPNQGLNKNPDDLIKFLLNAYWEKAPADIDFRIFTTSAQGAPPYMDDFYPEIRFPPFTMAGATASKKEGEGVFYTETGVENEYLVTSLKSGMILVAANNALSSEDTYLPMEIRTGNLYLGESQVTEYTNDLAGSVSFSMTSSMAMEGGIGASVLGPAISQSYPDQDVYTNDPDWYAYKDWPTQLAYGQLADEPLYLMAIDVANAATLEVHAVGHDNAPDIDIGVYLDGKDGNPLDGEIQAEEWMEESYQGGTAGSDERILIVNPPDGTYLIRVFGFTCTQVPAQFDLTISMIVAGGGGYSIEGPKENENIDDVTIYESSVPTSPYEQQTFNIKWAFPDSFEDGTYGGVLYFGPKSAPELLPILINVILDRTDPVIGATLPGEGIITSNAKPTISANLEEANMGKIKDGSLDPASPRMLLDGVDITDICAVSVPFIDDANTNFPSPIQGYPTGTITYEPAGTLSEGPHSVEVMLSDLAGNAVSKSWFFVIDSSMPFVNLDLGSETTYSNTNDVTFTGSMELGATLRVYGAGSTITEKPDGTFSAVISAVDGDNQLYFVATDTAGNRMEITHSLIIDKTSPSFKRVVALDGSTTNRRMTGIYGEMSELGTLAINNVPVPVNVDGTFRHEAIQLIEGQNTQVLAFTDLAGNTAYSYMNITLDTAAPTLQLGRIESTVNTDTLNITGKTDTGVASLTVNGKLVSVDSSGNFQQNIRLSPGTNTIVVESKDRAGNSAQEILTVSFVPDDGGRNWAAIGVMIALLVVGLILGLFLAPIILGGKKEEVPEEAEPVSEEVSEGEMPDEGALEPLPESEMPEGEVPEDVPAEGEMPAEETVEPLPAEEAPAAEPESEVLPEEPVPEEPAPEAAAEPEDPRITKLREAYESGKISKELYEKNLARFKGQ